MTEPERIRPDEPEDCPDWVVDEPETTAPPEPYPGDPEELAGDEDE